MRTVNDTTTIKQRIMIICDFLEMTPNQLSEKAGKGRNYIRNLTDNITSDFLVFLWCNYPEVNIEWILTGRGKMLRRNKEIFVDVDDLKDELRSLEINNQLLTQEVKALTKKIAFYERLLAKKTV